MIRPSKLQGSKQIFHRINSQKRQSSGNKSQTFDFRKKGELNPPILQNQMKMHGVLDKLNRESDRKFKAILKEQADSLDQCFLIFDQNAKSIFNNYKKSKWRSVLKSFMKFLNFD